MQTVKISHAEVILREDGIVEVFGCNHVYTTEDIKSIQSAIAQLKQKNKALILLHADNYTTIDQDARKYLSTPEAGIHSLAEAYVIRTLAQRLLLNFLIKVSGTPVPVRFFTHTAEALQWLKNHSLSN